MAFLRMPNGMRNALIGVRGEDFLCG